MTTSKFAKKSLLVLLALFLPVFCQFAWADFEVGENVNIGKMYLYYSFIGGDINPTPIKEGNNTYRYEAEICPGDFVDCNGRMYRNDATGSGMKNYISLTLNVDGSAEDFKEDSYEGDYHETISVDCDYKVKDSDQTITVTEYFRSNGANGENYEATYKIVFTVVSSIQRCRFCHKPDSKVRFSDFYGEVSIRCDHEEDDAYETAEYSTIIYDDDRIKTEEDSGAILSLEDMSTYVIHPESILIIRGEVVNVSKWEMLKGCIVGNVKKMMEGKVMGIEMSHCAASIKGTVFALEETGTESRAWLFTSKMDITSKKTGETISLQPGQKSVVGADGVIHVEEFDIQQVAKEFGISKKDLSEKSGLFKKEKQQKEDVSSGSKVLGTVAAALLLLVAIVILIGVFRKGRR